MTFEKPAHRPEAETTLARAPQVDPTVATLLAIQHLLEQQATLLQSISQELVALRETQSTYQGTLAKLDRQLRWARAVKIVRGVIFWLFWLGVAGVIAYYWVDLSTIWQEWANFIVSF